MVWNGSGLPVRARAGENYESRAQITGTRLLTRERDFLVTVLSFMKMPPNGPDEWRARIGHWENRKLRWYQAHCGSRPRVPLHLHLERVIPEAPLLCVLLLLSLAGNMATGVCEVGIGTFSSWQVRPLLRMWSTWKVLSCSI